MAGKHIEWLEMKKEVRKKDQYKFVTNPTAQLSVGKGLVWEHALYFEKCFMQISQKLFTVMVFCTPNTKPSKRPFLVTALGTQVYLIG